MTTPVYVQVATLPESLRKALAGVGYGKADIAVKASETYYMVSGGFTGRRSFVVCVDLATGRSERINGSWGGSNMFTPENPVDNDTTVRPIPPGCAIVHGSEGYGPTSASITVLPASLAPLLPATASVTEREKTILQIYKGYTSAGRKREFEDMQVKPNEIECLVQRGLLKANKAGAVTITTEGKNACGGR